MVEQISAAWHRAHSVGMSLYRSEDLDQEVHVEDFLKVVFLRGFYRALMAFHRGMMALIRMALTNLQRMLHVDQEFGPLLPALATPRYIFLTVAYVVRNILWRRN